MNNGPVPRGGEEVKKDEAMDPVAVGRVVAQLAQERDEARDAARQLFEAASLWGSFPHAEAKLVWVTELRSRWPWLKKP